MAFGWKNVAVARPHCGTDVFRLTGFLSDDDLIGHLRGSGGTGATIAENIYGTSKRHKVHWTARRGVRQFRIHRSTGNFRPQSQFPVGPMYPALPVRRERVG